MEYIYCLWDCIDFALGSSCKLRYRNLQSLGAVVRKFAHIGGRGASAMRHTSSSKSTSSTRRINRHGGMPMSRWRRRLPGKVLYENDEEPIYSRALRHFPSSERGKYELEALRSFPLRSARIRPKSRRRSPGTAGRLKVRPRLSTNI